MSKAKIIGSSCFICGVLPDNQENEKISVHFVTKTRFPKWKEVICKVGLKIGSRLCDRHFDVDDVIKGREIGGTFFKYASWKLKENAEPKYFLGAERPDGTFKGCTTKVKAMPKKHNPFAECFSHNKENAAVCKSTTNDKLSGSICDAGRKSEKSIPDAQQDFIDQLTIPSCNVAGNISEFEHSLNSSSVEIADHQLSAQDIQHNTVDQEACTQVAVVDKSQSQIGDQLHQGSAEVHLNCEMDKQPSNHLSLEDTPSLSPLNTSESTVMQCEENPTARDELDIGLLTRVVKIPYNWQWNNIKNSYDNISDYGNMIVYKVVMITSCLLTFFANGKEVFFPSLKTKFWTLFDLQKAIGHFDSQEICSGVMDLSLYDHKISNKILSSTGIMYSKKCKIVCVKEQKQCVNCRKHEGKLRYIKTSQFQKSAEIHKKLKTKQQRIKRFVNYRKKAAQMVTNLKRSIDALSANQLSEKIKHLPQ